MRTGEESNDEPGLDFGEGVESDDAESSTDTGYEPSEPEEPTDPYDPSDVDPTSEPYEPTDSTTDPTTDPTSDPTAEPFDPTAEPTSMDDALDQLSDEEVEEVLVDVFDDVAPGQGEEIVEDLESNLGLEPRDILDIVVGNYDDADGYGEGDPTLPTDETDESSDPTESDDWFDDVDTDVDDPTTGSLEPEDDLVLDDDLSTTDYGADDSISVSDMGEATEDLFDLS